MMYLSDDKKPRTVRGKGPVILVGIHRPGRNRVWVVSPRYVDRAVRSMWHEKVAYNWPELDIAEAISMLLEGYTQLKEQKNAGEQEL